MFFCWSKSSNPTILYCQIILTALCLYENSGILPSKRKLLVSTFYGQYMSQKKLFKIVTFLVLNIIALNAPLTIFAQTPVVGSLNITTSAGKKPEDTKFSVNGEAVMSGRTVTSPAEINSGAAASGEVKIPNIGAVKIQPLTKMNLYFNSNSISGDISTGQITVENLPRTSLNILTPDGAVTGMTTDQTSSVQITVKNGRSQIRGLAGEVSFNGIKIAAGQSFNNALPDKKSADKDDDDTVKSNNNLLLIALLVGGGGALAAVLALSAGGGSSGTVSPTR